MGGWETMKDTRQAADAHAGSTHLRCVRWRCHQSVETEGTGCETWALLVCLEAAAASLRYERRQYRQHARHGACMCSATVNRELEKGDAPVTTAGQQQDASFPLHAARSAQRFSAHSTSERSQSEEHTPAGRDDDGHEQHCHDASQQTFSSNTAQ